MAIFTPGPLVSSISGTVGSSNFAIGPRGSYVRQVPRPLNSRTVHQLRSREAHARHHLLWLGMTELIKLYWRIGARQTTYPDRLGRSRHLTGYQLWMRYADWRDTKSPWAFHTYPQVVAATPPYNLVPTFTDAPDYGISIQHTSFPNQLYISVHFSRAHSEVRPMWFPSGKLARALTISSTTFTLTDYIIPRFGELRLGEYFKLTVRVCENTAPYSLQSAPLAIVAAVEPAP